MPDPLHRKNAAEGVMYVALAPLAWIIGWLKGR
jgi:hypothetical protein